MKNKSYIWVSLVVLVFGIAVIPEIVKRVKGNDIVRSDRLDNVGNRQQNAGGLIVIGPAPKFKLTDQDNNQITNGDYEGKVFIVEFFFTRCPTICPKMNRNMVDIQNQFFGNPDFGIASITIDPDYDKSSILKQHAKILGAKSSNWHFLTGEQDYIYDLANKGFNLYAGENSEITARFEHSGLFALIDKKGKIRCRADEYGNPILYYDGIEKEGVKAITQDIEKLLKE